MITGHIVTFDNMGISALIHPLACKVRHTGAHCPLSRALVHGYTEGYRKDSNRKASTGTYLAVLRHDDEGEWVKLVPRGQDVDTAHEIGALLDAFLDEVGAEAGREAIVNWIVSDERSTLAAKTAKAR